MEKVNFIAFAKEKTALFLTVRQKGDFTAVAKEKVFMYMAVRRNIDFFKEKTVHIYNKKEKSESCSSR